MEEDGSRSWEEDIYWNHFQFIHFTLFLSTFDFQQQLALPKTFSGNLKNKLPENVTLKGPSGVVWNIGLTTRDYTVYFTDGWQRFVKDHSLKENDFLVFKYNGESLFEVLIFDRDNFCEKATSYFVGKCGHAQTEQEGSKAKNNNTSAFNTGVESASPEQIMADAVTKTTPVAVPSQKTSKRTKKKPVIEVTPVRTKKRGRPPKSANSFERSHDLVVCNKELSESSIVKRKRKEDEKKIAQSFTSSFPYFVKILKNGNVGGSRTLRIPRRFSAAHLPDDKTEVTLRNSRGKCWTVNSVPYAKRGMLHTFCGGWMSFVRDNGVNFGDTCIFELVSDYVMQVHIYGVGKESINNQNGHLKLDNK